MIPPTAEERAEVIAEARAELTASVATLKTPEERAQFLDAADECIGEILQIVGELRAAERVAAGALCLCGSGDPFAACGAQHLYPVMFDPANPRNRVKRVL